MLIKYHKEAFHEGEKDSCDDCYYQTGWKAHIKMYNFGCLKLTALKKLNRVKTIIGMYYDSYLFEIKGIVISNVSIFSEYSGAARGWIKIPLD